MREATTIKLACAICIILAALIGYGLPIIHSAAIGAQNNRAAADGRSSIIFAASIDNSPPLEEFHDQVLTAGILKDLGDAIAAKLHRQAVYVVVPRKRLDTDLQNGAVDGVCYDRPEWLTVPLHWTRPLISNEILLVAGFGVSTPHKLEDVAGEVIGLVLGYKYPELEALGQNYRREDAPNMQANIKKLIARRVKYAVIDKMSLDYQQKKDPEISNFSTLSIEKISTSCGFSLASKVPFSEIQQGIQELVNDGSVSRILAQYR